MKTFATALVLCFITATSFAHDHPAGSITGTDIQLFERNHGFAGQILENPVFGAFDHDPFGAQVTLRKGDSTLNFRLEKTGETYAGVFSEKVQDATKATYIEFLKVRKTGEATGEITLRIDGNEVVVNVTGKTFSDNHFHEPTFETVLKGKTVKFDFTGEACFGYSTNLSMMILGAMAHLSK